VGFNEETDEITAFQGKDWLTLCHMVQMSELGE